MRKYWFVYAIEFVLPVVLYSGVLAADKTEHYWLDGINFQAVTSVLLSHAEAILSVMGLLGAVLGLTVAVFNCRTALNAVRRLARRAEPLH